MRFLKIGGIVWGLIYLVTGYLTSFTWNANDNWASVALLFAMFLLPLPITIVALWFPAGAGRALFACIGVSMTVAVCDCAIHRPLSLAYISRFLLVTALYNIPHGFFAWAYIVAERRSREGGYSTVAG
jgi:hypothetical protein